MEETFKKMALKKNIKKNKEVENLKKQDKVLATLPSLKKEKEVFKKGEGLLSRLLRRKSVKPGTLDKVKRRAGSKKR